MKYNILFAAALATAIVLALGYLWAPAAASVIPAAEASSAPVYVPALVADPTPPPAPPSPPPRTIARYAADYGVDFALAKAIAVCESQLRPDVDNLYSSASGLYQFLDGTWAHYAKLKWGKSWTDHDVYDYGDSAELGVWVISKYGTGDWAASRHCWG